MKQIGPYWYEVAPNEKVTLSVLPIKVSGERIGSSRDGEPLPNTGSNEAPKYEFKVKREVGQAHIVKLVFQFVDGDHADARFDIKVSGSADGEFHAPTIRKVDGNNREQEYTFEVVQS